VTVLSDRSPAPTAELPQRKFSGLAVEVSIGGQLHMRVATTVVDNRVVGIDVRAERIAGSVPDGLLRQLGEMATVLLQSGYPLEKLIESWRDVWFEPLGHTDDPDIQDVKSPLDYVARWLERNYL